MATAPGPCTRRPTAPRAGPARRPAGDVRAAPPPGSPRCRTSAGRRLRHRTPPARARGTSRSASRAGTASSATTCGGTPRRARRVPLPDDPLPRRREPLAGRPRHQIRPPSSSPSTGSGSATTTTSGRSTSQPRLAGVRDAHLGAHPGRPSSSRRKSPRYLLSTACTASCLVTARAATVAARSTVGTSASVRDGRRERDDPAVVDPARGDAHDDVVAGQPAVPREPGRLVLGAQPSRRLEAPAAVDPLQGLDVARVGEHPPVGGGDDHDAAEQADQAGAPPPAARRRPPRPAAAP